HPDAELLTIPLHGRPAGPDAVGAIQVLGQLGVRPVSPVQPLGGWPLDDPTADLVAQISRDLRLGPLGPAGLQPGQAMLQVAVEPSLHGAGRDAQVFGDLVMRPILGRQTGRTIWSRSRWPATLEPRYSSSRSRASGSER